MPGNKGGSGRPSNIVRQLALEAFDRQLGRLERIAEGSSIRARVGSKARQLPATVKEQGAAIVALGRLGGMAQKIEVTGADGSPFIPVDVLTKAKEDAPAPLPTGGPDVPPV